MTCLRLRVMDDRVNTLSSNGRTGNRQATHDSDHGAGGLSSRGFSTFYRARACATMSSGRLALSAEDKMPSPRSLAARPALLALALTTLALTPPPLADRAYSANSSA